MRRLLALAVNVGVALVLIAGVAVLGETLLRLVTEAR